MVGGTIKDFYVNKNFGDLKEVRFLAKDNDYTDTCCVRAKVPNVVMKEIKVGGSIWWNASNVYLGVYGVEDAKFEKVGFASGDEKTFYQRKAGIII